MPVFFRKNVRKIWNSHFWPFLIFSDNFSVHITLIQCNGLESIKKFIEKKYQEKHFCQKKFYEKNKLEQRKFFTNFLKFGNFLKVM